MNIKQTAERGRRPMLKIVSKWRTRRLLSGLIKWGGEDEEEWEEEEVRHIKTVQYDPLTGSASAYGAESETFENIVVILFESVGDGSKIKPEWAELEARSGYEFTVKQDGPVLEIWEESM